MEPTRYRHEIKHIIDPLQREELIRRLSALLAEDTHARADGTYLIRSLYFDSPGDAALREKSMGAPRREKFRLRYYNGDTSFIRLEKKSKINRLTRKESSPIPREACERLLWGDISVLREMGDPLSAELYIRMQGRGLHPVSVVDYERRSFTHPMGNTRVTLDSHIRCTGAVRGFLDPACPTLPCDMVEGVPVSVLEVKYDAFLPDTVRYAVQIEHCRPTPFSKYEFSRRFD